ncbi:MAG: glutathione S-transferase family protein [Rhodospirillaceae bacterium]|mgnify:FL=1|nr:glutathione S-transferase family protein [Rhodospirillaceae bacterium]MBT5180128.1 glutathione S-transferase family protein [Rhodospirillaceae bacterium]
MLTLYHGDTSVCSQKVRLALTEKQLEWSGEFIDLGKGDQFDPEYMKLNPNAVVPTLIHDGKVIIESSMINEYVDDAFPDVPLRPTDPYSRARMRLWVKQLDDGIHYAINSVTFAIAMRLPVLEQSPEEQKARWQNIPDPARSAKMRELIERGIDSSLVVDALRRLDKMLADMETALKADDWLAGDTYSLADAGLTPYVNRMNMLGLSTMWERQRPNLTDWYVRVRGRSNFSEAILAHDPPNKIKIMNEAGAAQWPEVERKLQYLGG